jgi:tetratricopeptide (TPR) repeat protein
MAAALGAVMILGLVVGLGGFGLKRTGLPREPIQNLRMTVTAQGFFSEGVRLYDAKDFAAGAYALDRAIELNPRMASAYLWRGNCNSALHHFPEAIADYTRSLELSPNQPECFGRRGAAYLNSGKFDEALADLNRAIALNPAYMLALQDRSGLYLRRKQYAKAIADCDTALRMNPDTKWAVRYKNEARNGMAGVTGGLVAPNLLSPAPGTVFGHFPRDTMVVWGDVPGAVSYVVEWDYKFSGTWASERGFEIRLIRTTQPMANFKFIGRQPGRWRVWAIDPAGQPGPKSGWREFTYTH